MGVLQVRRPQLTTTVGIGTLTPSIVRLSALFGDYNVVEFAEACKHIKIADLFGAIACLVVAVAAILYDENKDTMARDTPNAPPDSN